MEFSIIIPKSEFGFSLGGLADVQQSVRSRFRSRFFPTGVAWSEATLVRVLCGIRAGPVRDSCGSCAGPVRDSCGIRAGCPAECAGRPAGCGEQNRFLLFRFFGKSKRTLGTSKVSKWTFHFNSLSMKSLFETGSTTGSADLATAARPASASAPAQLHLSVTVLCSGLHVPRTAGDRVAFFVDTRRRKVVLFERFSRKVLQF